MTRLRIPLLSLCFVLLVLASSARAVTWRDLLGHARPAPSKEFHYGAAADQFAQLWLPDGKGPFPVVAMFHGGCWQESLPGVELMVPAAEDLRQQGIAVWNIEYRRIGAEGAGYPGTFLDVADAMDYLQRIGIDYGLDLSRVAVLGHSAGGQLALWAAARGKLKRGNPLYRRHPQKVMAAFSIAGIDDLALYRDNGNPSCGVPGSIDGLVGRDGKNSYADTSPAAMLPLHVPQLVVSGTDDDIVPPGFGDAYAAAAAKAGDKVESMTFEGAGHIDLIDPDSAAWAQIRAKVLTYLKQNR